VNGKFGILIYKNERYDCLQHFIQFFIISITIYIICIRLFLLHFEKYRQIANIITEMTDLTI